MKCILSICLIISFSACQLEQEDLSGYWISSNYSSISPIEKLAFHNDTLQLVYETNVSQTFTYQLKNNQLLLPQGDSLITKTINQLIGDTLWVDSIPFQRVDKTTFEHLPSIDLIDFPSKTPINIESYPSYRIGVLLNDSLQIILGDKKAEISDLPLFLSCHHCENQTRKAFLFIDKTIELIDLSMIYYFLKAEGIRNIYLVTQKKGNQYFGIKDRAQIWEKDLEAHFRYFNMPSPPPFENNYQSVFIKNHQPLEEFTIASPNEGAFIIEKFCQENHCIINIPVPQISVKGYLQLKVAYQAFRKTQRQILSKKKFNRPFEELTLEQKRACLKEVKTIRFNFSGTGKTSGINY